MAVVVVAGLDAGKSALLALFGLLGGVGITALGPGGVLITVGLYALTDLPPAQIAGTAIAANLATGLLGATAYRRSGQLREPAARRLAAILVAGAVVATPLGVLANSRISGPLFGTLLGVCVAAVGGLVWVRVRGPLTAGSPSTPALFIGGAGVAGVSGLFGLGGQLLSVPLLVAGGISMLPALGAAQTQSIVIAALGTLGYAARGDVSWSLAALVGLPALVGALAGWRLAQAVDADRLRLMLAPALMLVGAYLIARSV